MSSYVDMSLDDIIQKNRKTKPKRINKLVVQPPKKNQPPAKVLPVTDARNKIISKKRIQITDAREKLAELAKQKDARLKLDKLRQERMARLPGQGHAPGQRQGRPVLPNRGKFIRTIQNKERAFVDPSRQVAYNHVSGSRNLQSRQPLHTKKFLESRSIERSTAIKNYDRPLRLKPILRTVENDIVVIDEDDPMGEEYTPSMPALHNRKASLQLKIIAHNNDVSENRHSKPVTVYRNSVPDREISPPRPPSILKKRPMAAMRSEQLNQKTEKPVMEYRIIVSNLRNTVTGGDIEELFGDVGDMVESRLVRPGTAEVIYKTQEKAQKAVELYHNRQLDGQPMNCLLVTPRTPATSQRNTSKPALYSTNSNVEPDISTFHKVLFSNL